MRSAGRATDGRLVDAAEESATLRRFGCGQAVAPLQALKDGGRLGKVQLVAFDEADDTLQGIVDGQVFGTVVQNPYQYG